MHKVALACRLHINYVLVTSTYMYHLEHKIDINTGINFAMPRLVFGDFFKGTKEL